MRALRAVGVVGLGAAIGVVAALVNFDAGVAMFVGSVAGYSLGRADGIVEALGRRR